MFYSIAKIFNKVSVKHRIESHKYCMYAWEMIVSKCVKVIFHTDCSCLDLLAYLACNEVL